MRSSSSARRSPGSESITRTSTRRVSPSADRNGRSSTSCRFSGSRSAPARSRLSFRSSSGAPRLTDSAMRTSVSSDSTLPVSGCASSQSCTRRNSASRSGLNQ